jgi:hypothetical protein
VEIRKYDQTRLVTLFRTVRNVETVSSSPPNVTFLSEFAVSLLIIRIRMLF